MSLPLLSGLVAAPFTPFDAEGNLDSRRIPELAAALHQQGVKGAFICGSTGEGTVLTTDERQRVASAWMAARVDGLSVIVHVGHNSLSEAVGLARHAAAVGADAIAMLAPIFPRPGNLEDLVASCALVAAAAPKLPFYYYHMPAATGLGVAMADFISVAGDRIPNFAGIKFTHEHLMDFGQALAYQPNRFVVLHGRDETLLAGLALGAKGAVGSTYNYCAPVYHRVMRAFAAADLEGARREQARAVRFIEIMVRHGGHPAGKAIMKLIGLDCGGVRLPQRSLTPAAEERLKADLVAAGFFDAISA